MQHVHSFLCTLLFIAVSLSSGAQSLDFFINALVPPNYSECAAILYNGNILVDEYSPTGKCKLDEKSTKGVLSVATVKSSDKGCAAPARNIAFKVAIKNGRTNTIWMYSEKALWEAQLEDILKKCEPGDRIILMTVDQRYSLPHPEIELNWGC
ncbi:MAG: hypothetical protein J5I98_35770 [Phaeodactylibacter sp.]|nr:hypothetical protein [Phaeodactylibacter sp.]